MNSNNLKTKLFILFFYYIVFLTNIKIGKEKNNNNKRIGIVGFLSDTNIGNNLVKYSMYVILERFHFRPTLITLKSKMNIYFLRKYLRILEISNYSQLKEENFDIMIVDSDQTWNYRYRYLLEAGFLSFSQNWTIPKFVYAASLAHGKWNVSKEVLKKAKLLVRQFSGISVREKNSVHIIENILGIKPVYVLDPTFLLDKNDYLKLIRNFDMGIDLNENYLCTYILDKSNIIKNFVDKASIYFKYKILPIRYDNNQYIEKFIFSINKCKSMITDSFHGTVFSIIFNKPFITFINELRGKERFISLNQTFSLNDRFIFPKSLENKDINNLRNSPNINKKKFKRFQKKSIEYLKKNLGII